MSILLFVVGAITLVVGALAIAFGIPVNEFSFGNTLIMAGTTGVVGGLIVIALGMVVAHLQRLADVVAARAPLRPNRPPEPVEAGRPPAAASRVPFPSQPQPATDLQEAPPLVGPPLAAAAPIVAASEPRVEAEAPTLPNPDVPPVEPVEEVPEAPSPLFGEPPPTAAFAEPAAPPVPGFDGGGAGEHEAESEPLPSWLSTQRTPEPPAVEPTPEPPRGEANFEAVWPTAEDSVTGPAVSEESERAAAAPTAPEPGAVAPEPSSEYRNVAILKSGVVDGMGYTLYVDGSIEAELPQGTLRFASINELREHLEKTS